jgi:hypothetical protein
MDQDQEDPTQQWDKLWNNPHWPKIKIFQWLILHNRILTWENLRKRGFIGPSRCHLCQAKEETMNHLLDECTYTTEIWDWAQVSSDSPIGSEVTSPQLSISGKRTTVKMKR